MSLLLMPTTTSVAVPVQGKGKGPPGEDEKGPGCIKCCNEAAALELENRSCKTLEDNNARRQCRKDVKDLLDVCLGRCHNSQFDPGPDTCDLLPPTRLKEKRKKSKKVDKVDKVDRARPISFFPI